MFQVQLLSNLEQGVLMTLVVCGIQMEMQCTWNGQISLYDKVLQNMSAHLGAIVQGYADKRIELDCFRYFAAAPAFALNEVQIRMATESNAGAEVAGAASQMLGHRHLLALLQQLVVIFPNLIRWYDHLFILIRAVRQPLALRQAYSVEVITSWYVGNYIIDNYI